MKKDLTYDFEMEFSVRDYECDMQGIVNNSVYLNYMEHTRHEFAIKNGDSFLERTMKGEYFVVGRMEIKYITALKSGDRFVSKLKLEDCGERKKIFHQELFKLNEPRSAVSASVSVYKVAAV